MRYTQLKLIQSNKREHLYLHEGYKVQFVLRCSFDFLVTSYMSKVQDRFMLKDVYIFEILLAASTNLMEMTAGKKSSAKDKWSASVNEIH